MLRMPDYTRLTGSPHILRYRKQSEKYGLKVWLCMRHHTGDRGVHFDKGLDRKLKEMAQTKFEEAHTREEFIKIFGRNYL